MTQIEGRARENWAVTLPKVGGESDETVKI